MTLLIDSIIEASVTLSKDKNAPAFDLVEVSSWVELERTIQGPDPNLLCIDLTQFSLFLNHCFSLKEYNGAIYAVRRTFRSCLSVFALEENFKGILLFSSHPYICGVGNFNYSPTQGL